MKKLIQKANYAFKSVLWSLNGYLGRSTSLAEPAEKVTVLIAYFNPLRLKKINHQVRNILKCTFVDRIIISNHNPEIHVEDELTIKDDRLVVLNQVVQRDCGFRWLVAGQFHPKYLIVVDDDMLLFSWQFAALFGYLLEEPEIPHGVSGMLYPNRNYLEFHSRENMSVDFLCEAYAVTGIHLNHYLELMEHAITDKRFSRIIDSSADFVVISRVGNGRPKIHDIGRLFRHETFNEKKVAIHMGESFEMNLTNVLSELNALGLLRP